MLAGVGAELTTKVESALNVCILKSPEVVTVPPEAQIKVGTPDIFSVASLVCFHPLVPSTYTKLNATPLVSIIALLQDPLIFDEFLHKVKLLV